MQSRVPALNRALLRATAMLQCFNGKTQRTDGYVTRVALWSAVTACVVTLLALSRIIATYFVFCQTYDEPAHVCRGMLWLHDSPYRHPLHPPLAPVAFAIGAAMTGASATPTGDKWIDGNAVLYSTNYRMTLTGARIGNLLFFVAVTASLWLWCNEYYGPVCAAVSVMLFTSLPVVLAHAGLATTDMAVTAGLTTSIWLFLRWLDKCSLSRSCVLGVSIGITLVCKLSAVVFLPACFVVACAFHRRAEGGKSSSQKRLLQICVIAIVSMYIVVIAYRGSVGPIYSPHIAAAEDMNVLDQLAESHSIVRWILEVPVPAPEYFRGLTVVVDKNNQGHAPYFLGVSGRRSSVAFFPVILAIKTPIAFGIAFLCGVFSIIRWPERRGEVVPLACLSAVLAVAMMSRINLGVRHILPIYPMIAICAGIGVCRLWQSNLRRRSSDGYPAIRRVFAVALVTIGSVESLRVHPDYIAYFNAIAGDRPDYFVVDSDLDWGQDLDRLAIELRQRKINYLHLAYFGTADLSKHDLPTFDLLVPNRRPKGYVAISMTSLRTNEGFAWIKDQKPIAIVGKSILLYDLE